MLTIWLLLLAASNLRHWSNRITVPLRVSAVNSRRVRRFKHGGIRALQCLLHFLQEHPKQLNFQSLA